MQLKKILMIALLVTKCMKVWMIYPIMFLSSAFSAFQRPAFSASIPLIVEKENLSNANGMIQFSNAASNLLTPVASGAFYSFIKLEGLMALDFTTYLFAFITIISVKIPDAVRISETEEKEKISIFHAFKNSWKYLKSLDEILSTVFVFAILNFIANICMVLITPLVLSHHDTAVYGIVQTVTGLSMLAGGIISSFIPDVKNKNSTIFLTLIMSGTGLFIAGLKPSWIVISAGLFIFYILVPYANTLFATQLQTKIESNMMGRSDALIGALLKIETPFAYIIAGPLADYVFNPLMAENGKLSKTFFNAVFSCGKGRGYGVMISLCRIILSAICITNFLKTKKISKGHLYKP